jgi:hypothetical protein
MGRTLFWYVFKDLVKIFMMASGALAGIMSFGGLLRPLTQQGLDAGQVSKMLGYFTFPMMAYSLPVAALFAATMVYGRLSADNELTACRAGGISHLGSAMPAFVLGLGVALLSMVMLCFVVPIYTLKVEQVIYSNLAKLIANKIERTHEIPFGDFNVFAQKAYLPAPGAEMERLIADLEPFTGPQQRQQKEAILAASGGGPGAPADPTAQVAAGVLAAREEVMRLATNYRDRNHPKIADDLQAVAEALAPVTHDTSVDTIAGRVDRAIAQCRELLPEIQQADKKIQRVVLEGVSIVTYERGSDRPSGNSARPDSASGAPISAGGGDDDAEKPAKSGKAKDKSAADRPDKPDPQDRRFKTPREFLVASSATIEIRSRDDEHIDLLIGLQSGTKFPRDFAGGSQIGIGSTQFGPIEMTSPIKEDPKFMKVQDLKKIYGHPEQSRRISTYLTSFIRRDQTLRYLDRVRASLNRRGIRRFSFDDPKGRVTITLDEGAPDAVPEGAWAEELVVAGTKSGTVTFEREGDEPTLQTAQTLRLRVRPDPEKQEMQATVELIGRSPVAGTGPAATRPVSGNYSDIVTVPMPEDVKKLEGRKIGYYRTNRTIAAAGDLTRMNRDLIVLSNMILSESNVRASFAVSCFVLVLVGCAMGMMFRSGNFLTAFAVSFVPALLCITLIVSGQQTCHAVPWNQPETHNPIRLGIALIWSGNAINLLLAIGLLWRLQRQ